MIIHPMNLKNVLCQIYADSSNLHFGRSFRCVADSNDFHYGTSMPYLKEGVHSITFNVPFGTLFTRYS